MAEQEDDGKDLETLLVTQNKGDRFAIDHHGGVALYGQREQPPLDHTAHVTHGTAPDKPLVHMVYWDDREVAKVEMGGRVVLVGDPQTPVSLDLSHHFVTDHHQTHRVDTSREAPINHALQILSPLELRFCNPWHCASDYRMEINLGGRTMTVRLTGATVCTPQPCPEQPPPPPIQ